MTTEDFVGVTELAELLGVRRQTASAIASRYADFPEPVAHLAAGRVWATADVIAWIDSHPDRKPGRPRRT